MKRIVTIGFAVVLVLLTACAPVQHDPITVTTTAAQAETTLCPTTQSRDMVSDTTRTTSTTTSVTVATSETTTLPSRSGTTTRTTRTTALQPTRLPINNSGGIENISEASYMKITDVVVGTAFGNGTPTDARFAYYRIPGIVVTSKDTVIAYFEARTNGTDYDGIDIVAYRSTDGGETFGEPIALAKGAATGTTTNNPVMIAGENGVVHFLYCVEYGVCDQCHLAATSACPHGAGVFYRKSTDDGKTWSRPVNITDSTEPDLHDVIATGPGHGIRLSNGTLVVPVWMVQKGRGWSLKAHGGASGSVDVCMLYSTNDGTTWQLGEPVAYDHTVLVNPNETTIVETFDGRVMLNARLESGECRAIAYSDNGYSGWTELKKAPQLIDPACAAGSARYNAKDDSKDLLLFVNCANVAGRSRLTVRGSRDNGKTWTLQRQLVEYAAGYSDIAVDSKGTIYVLFEFSSGQSCRLARFNYSYLLNG